MKSLMRLIIALALVMSFGGQVIAEDPVDPCANESGAAYGLCTAYYAIGCGGPNANEEACNKIEDNYEKIEGEPIPGSITCPCWTDQEFDAFISNISLYGVTPIQCITSGFAFSVYENNSVFNYRADVFLPDFEDGPYCGLNVIIQSISAHETNIDELEAIE